MSPLSDLLRLSVEIDRLERTARSPGVSFNLKGLRYSFLDVKSGGRHSWSVELNVESNGTVLWTGTVAVYGEGAYGVGHPTKFKVHSLGDECPYLDMLQKLDYFHWRDILMLPTE